MLVVCGNSGSGSSASVDEGVRQFIDSVVGGLEYQSGSIRGLTSADGYFRFEQGANIRFFVGDIILGEGLPADVMSPLDIVGATSDVTDDHVQ